MANPEIVAALSNAIERNEDLNEAGETLISAGYSPEEVEEAKKQLLDGVLSSDTSTLQIPEQADKEGFFSKLNFFKKSPVPIDSPIPQEKPVEQEITEEELEKIQPIHQDLKEIKKKVKEDLPEPEEIEEIQEPEEKIEEEIPQEPEEKPEPLPEPIIEHSKIELEEIGKLPIDDFELADTKSSRQISKPLIDESRLKQIEESMHQAEANHQKGSQNLMQFPVPKPIIERNSNDLVVIIIVLILLVLVSGLISLLMFKDEITALLG